MARRRKISIKKRSRRNKTNVTKGNSKKRMLRTGNLNHFEYVLKQMLTDVEGGGTIFANVFSKSSNIGIAEAIKYLDGVVGNGSLERAKADEIIDLLDRSSKMR